MNERVRIFMEGYFDITVDSRGTGYTGNVKLLILNHFGMEP